MRREKEFMVVVLAALLPLAAAYAQQDKVFQSDKLKYSFHYSSDYKLQTAGDLTYVVSPRKDKKNLFSANVNVAAKFVGTQSLRDEFEKGKKGLPASLGDATIIDEKKDKVAGLDAYRLVYTSHQNKVDFKLAQVMLKSASGLIYVITYTALSDQYDRDIKIFETVVKSFRITGSL
jgi:hypothetical protein